MSEGALKVLDTTIAYLEEVRLKFIETKEKCYWHDMIQLLPSSYNQLRTVTMNYETELFQIFDRAYLDAKKSFEKVLKA